MTFNDRIENFLNAKKNEKYNILFFDPPFSDQSFKQNLFFLKNNKMYKNQYIVIIHREKNTQDVLENHIEIIISKRYGRSKIIFGIFN